MHINFDANASYGLLPEVREGCVEALALHGNPSSIHQIGQGARSLLEAARYEILELVGSPKGVRLVFTSGATEANTTAVCLGTRERSSSAVSTRVEHPAILESLHFVHKKNDIELLLVAPAEIPTLDSYVQSNTRFISLMSANNESGHLYPVSEIFTRAKQASSDILCHTDAVQVAGKLPLNFASINCDAMTLSAHKMGGLTGVGALLIRDIYEPEPLIYGGPQESRWRAGTENVIGIHSFGIAARLAREELDARVRFFEDTRVRLITTIQRELPEAQVLFTGTERLPNTISIRIPGLSADDLVVALDLAGVAISAGSACASGKPLASHVLVGYGLTEFEAREVVRLSLNHIVAEREIELGLAAFIRCVRQMRSKKECAA